MTKRFYCPYHTATAYFFLKTLEKGGTLPLNRVIVMTVVSAITDPDFLQGGIPFDGGTAMLFAE